MSIKGIIRQSQGSHWYTPQGKPAFTVKSAKGQDIKPDIRHAKTMGLLPSVTTILKVIDKPIIDNWRVERAIKASIASKRNTGERIKGYIERILLLAQSKSSKAVNFGSDVHSFIEMRLKGEVFESVYIPKATAKAIDEYLAKEIESAESEVIIINNRLKFAGTFDCLAKLKDGRTCLYDFKTQGTKPARPVTFYDDFIIQLGAYSMSDNLKNGHTHTDLIDCVRSLVISSTEAGRIEVKEYTPEEVNYGQRLFTACNQVFRLIKKLED